MVEVREALALVLGECAPFRPEPFALEDALGLVLAEDAISDVDSPPFTKSLMDGFAVRALDLPDGTGMLRIVEEVTAGRVPTRPVGAGEATRIMTGAPIPAGADSVVRIEECEIDAAAGTVRVVAPPFKPGTNVIEQGMALRRGERILPAGRLLRPQELGALAELGSPRVQARRRPRVAVLATGDELVPISATPGPGQIRNSNETMLVAQIRRAGAEPVALGIARDHRDELAEKIREGLRHDVLVLSGGVSAGVLDLVPSELASAGVRQVFHRVNVKPGKPVWYGRSASCHVFGLPGNPVSSMVCFELFTRPAIRRLMGFDRAAPQPIRARLAAAHVARGDRPTYHPSRLQWTDTGPVVDPVVWQGSSDLRATVEASAMALFPHEGTYRAGDVVEVYCWD